MGELDPGTRFLKSGEAERILSRTRPQILRFVREGRLRRVRRGGHWRYYAAEVRSLASSLGLTEESRGAGATEALAVDFIREGITDGEIVQRTGLPLDSVERLRASLGLATTAHETTAARRRAEEEDRPSLAKAHERVTKARERLAEQRAALRRRLYGDKGP